MSTDLAAIRANRLRCYERREPFFQDSVFTPRWHGWARTSTTRFEPTTNPSLWTSETIRSGWVRRPKGSQYWEINYADDQEKTGILLREHVQSLAQVLRHGGRPS